MWSGLRLLTAPYSIYWVFINALNMQIEPMWIAGEIYFISHWRYGTTCSVIELAAWENSIYPRCVTLPQAESTDIPIWFGSLSSTPLTEWKKWGTCSCCLQVHMSMVYQALIWNWIVWCWQQCWTKYFCMVMAGAIDRTKSIIRCVINALHMWIEYAKL